MSTDDMLPLQRDLWERVSDSSPYWGPGAAVVFGLALRDSLGVWGAVAVVVVVFAVASSSLDVIARRSRRRRLSTDAERGIVEAVVRFPDEADQVANYGWKEGVLRLTDTGFTFQKLQGRSGKRQGAPVELFRPRPLGPRPLHLVRVPALKGHSEALGFVVGHREFEIALHPGYLSNRHLRERLVPKSSPT